MKKISFFLLLFFFFSCQNEHIDIENLNGNKIIILGHGGMGTGITHPTNTSESILKCFSLGTDGSEIDIQLSKDSVLIAFHDHDLSENTTMKGLINSLDWSEIKEAKYTNIPFLDYSIISLDQLFSSLSNPHDYLFSLDCKLVNASNNKEAYYLTYVNAINKIAKKYNLEDHLYIESQQEDFLRLLQEINPSIKLLIYPSSFESGYEIAKRMNLFGITISTDKVTKEQIELAHKDSLFITLWGVNSRSKNIEAIKKNPDIIQSDRLSHILGLLK